MAKQLMGRLEMHADTRLLIAYLRERFVKAANDFVSYADLTAAIGGRDVQKEARGLLMTARKHLNHNDGVLLIAIHGEGLSREMKIGAYLDHHKRRIGRQARQKAANAVAALELDGVTNEERRSACLELSMLSAIAALTQPKARKQIEGRINANNPKELPTAETLMAQFKT